MTFRFWKKHCRWLRIHFNACRLYGKKCRAKNCKLWQQYKREGGGK